MNGPTASSCLRPALTITVKGVTIMPDTLVAKRCKKCKEVKSISAFYKNRAICKPCIIAYQLIYKKTEKPKAYQKRYSQSPRGKQAHLDAMDKYSQTEKGRASQRYRRIKDSHKCAARAAINNAITLGRIRPVNSLFCVCGQIAKQYHHYLGYAPEHYFDVVAFCVPCHRKAHVICLPLYISP